MGHTLSFVIEESAVEFKYSKNILGKILVNISKSISSGRSTCEPKTSNAFRLKLKV
jgi:hypothetical protein